MAARKPKAKAKPKEEETTGQFELDGEVLEFDLSTLTFGEAEELECYFGKSQARIADDGDYESARGTLFIAYLAKKRLDPGTTLDDLRTLKISTLKEVEGERPTDSASATNGNRS